MSKPANCYNESSSLVPPKQQPQEEHDIAVVMMTPDSVVAVPVEQPCHPNVTKRFTFNLTICGDTTIRIRRIGKRNLNVCLCGDHKLDLRQVSFSHLPETNIKIIIVKLCGNIHLIVPPNTNVSTCAIMPCGDKRIETHDDSSGDESSHDVKLTVVQLCGDVIVTNNDE
jgi:hypothetical protein